MSKSSDFSSIVAILPVLASMTGGNASNVTRSTIIADLFQNYDHSLPPRYNESVGDQQVLISLNMFVISMFSISEADMDYSMSIFFRERWRDERLTYNNKVNLSRLELDVSVMDNVWKPDIFIKNEKQSNFHHVTVPNKLMHIYSDGTVQYSIRVTGTFSCQMNLKKYPFDTQKCLLEAESYGHSTETILLEWTESAVKIGEGISFPQFTIIDVITYDCAKDYFGITYGCVGVKFVLYRNYAYYITQVYIPSILIVVLSWVNFWLDPAAVPARISLALLTVLTMTTQSAGARANLPRVSYIKAIDVWMATCLAFVFLGLIEFAFVNVQSRVANKRASRSAGKKQGLSVKEKGQVKGPSVFLTDISDLDDEFMNGTPKGNQEKDCKSECVEVSWRTRVKSLPCVRYLSDIQTRPRHIDKISRWLFPLTFALFNLIYWVFYFTWEPDDD